MYSRSMEQNKPNGNYDKVCAYICMRAMCMYVAVGMMGEEGWTKLHRCSLGEDVTLHGLAAGSQKPPWRAWDEGWWDAGGQWSQKVLNRKAEPQVSWQRGGDSWKCLYASPHCQKRPGMQGVGMLGVWLIKDTSLVTTAHRGHRKEASSTAEHAMEPECQTEGRNCQCNV